MALPKVNSDRFSTVSDVDHLAARVRDSLGIEPFVIRCVLSKADESTERKLDVVYAVENLSADWQPPKDSQWVGRTELGNANITDAEHKQAIENFLIENETDNIPPDRPLWARAGWYTTAYEWTRKQLSEAGHQVVDPIEQVRTWGISVVLRARTNGGNFYFKQAAKLPLFANEPGLTETLAKRFPKSIPSPVAIDNERGWMLTADFGDIVKDDQIMVASVHMVRQYAEMQRASADMINDLFKAGCIDRRLNLLQAQIDPLVQDAVLQNVIAPEGIERLSAITPRLKDMCAELDGFNVPPALLHGDLYRGNIALKDDKFVFFDWTDASVSHPFLDMIVLLRSSDLVPFFPGTQPPVLDAYLSYWTDFEPMERLVQAWELAKPLGKLYQVISYQNIAANIESEAHAEIIGGISFWLQRLLSSTSEW